MKIRNSIGVLAIALFFVGCGSSKVASQAELNKAELEKAYMEKEHELKMEQMEAEFALKRKEIDAQAKMVFQPCNEEAYDGDGYMGALGVSNGQATQHIAMSAALKSAKANIMNRYMGAFKSGIKEYTNTTVGVSGNSRDMAKLEGGVMSAGEAAINKYVSEVCRQVLQNDLGGYDAYIAIHVNTEEVKKEIATKLEALEVDYNAEKLFDSIEKQVESQKKN